MSFCLKYGPEITDGKATWYQCPIGLCMLVGKCAMTEEIEPE